MPVVEGISQLRRLELGRSSFNLLHVIGASLSEPHIDGDVRPTLRGMFVYMYLAAWCVCPPYVPEKSRARTH